KPQSFRTARLDTIRSLHPGAQEADLAFWLGPLMDLGRRPWNRQHGAANKLSMNRPTPDPSQEGSRHPSASCPFPSREGLGVGSWSQCMRKSERRLFMNRVRKREHPSSVAELLQRVEAPRTPNAPAQWPSAWDFAKRLECVRLAGAFHGSWSRCLRESE